MSYDLYLEDPVTKETIKLDTPHHMRGGTFQVGGCPEAHLNITYNYGAIFRKTMGEEGIRSIYEKTGAESIPILENAIAQLGNDVNEDYWEPTEGNAKKALLQLVALAKMRPDGVWFGD